MLAVEIDSIRDGPHVEDKLAVLREQGSDRCLLVPVNAAEADSIALRLEGAETPHPRAHDHFLDAVDTMGGTVRRVVISRLADETLFATVELEYADGLSPVGARPGDALALAVVSGAPIFADDAAFGNGGPADEPGSP